ncbi:MAG: IS66 family transposase, partial [Bradymonadaceae bacterium]
MKKEKIDIPSVAEIDDLNEASARSLLKQLVALIAMLHGLIKELRETLADARHQLADERHQREQLQRALFGPSSEKMPPMEREVKKRIKKEETPEEAALRKEKTKEKREKNAQRRRDELETRVVDHPIEDPCCPNCNANVDDAARLADVVSEEYEIVTTRLIRREHHQEKRVCGCGTFLYGDAVERVADGVIYGPELHAHVVVSKCADSIPVERLAKSLRRAGMAIGRSTLNDLFHRVAALLLPIYVRMIERIAESEYVSADETTVKVQQQGKCRTAWMWTFIGSKLVTYVFSASRSGETPLEVLGTTRGNLQVDGFTGYNHVTRPEGRTRSGCWSHARRKFFEAMKTAADEARHVLDQILEMYLVEYEALDKNILGTEAHRLLRQAKTKPIVEALFTWLENEKAKHLPK